MVYFKRIYGLFCPVCPLDFLCVETTAVNSTTGLCSFGVLVSNLYIVVSCFTRSMIVRSIS